MQKFSEHIFKFCTTVFSLLLTCYASAQLNFIFDLNSSLVKKPIIKFVQVLKGVKISDMFSHVSLIIVAE